MMKFLLKHNMLWLSAYDKNDGFGRIVLFIERD